MFVLVLGVLRCCGLVDYVCCCFADCGFGCFVVCSFWWLVVACCDLRDGLVLVV